MEGYQSTTIETLIKPKNKIHFIDADNSDYAGKVTKVEGDWVHLENLDEDDTTEEDESYNTDFKPGWYNASGWYWFEIVHKF